MEFISYKREKNEVDESKNAQIHTHTITKRENADFSPPKLDTLSPKK